MKVDASPLKHPPVTPQASISARVDHWMLALSYMFLWCLIGLAYHSGLDTARMSALILITLVLGFLITRRLKISENRQRLFYYVVAYIGLTMIPGLWLPDILVLAVGIIEDPEGALFLLMLPLYLFWGLSDPDPVIFVPLVGLVAWVVARFTLSEPADA